MGRPATIRTTKFCKVRKSDRLHITGPCVIFFKRGRAEVEVDMPAETKVSHNKPGKRLRNKQPNG